jgi:polyisoprenoid-binding protein YceI
MAIPAGRHELSAEQGRITLRTSRDGLAAQAGHDLILELPDWSGVLTVADGMAPAGLEVTIDLGVLQVHSGSGGIKPLTDRDKREIASNARKLLRADRYPQATFTATSFQPDPGGGGTIDGTMALAGQSRPLRLTVATAGPGGYQATTTLRQTDFGIKPYSAFLGSLKVADVVAVTVDLDLSKFAPAGTP